MKKIVLLSDTHGYLDQGIITHIKEADEVWHAGDIGGIETADRIAELKPIRAVYGNIDDEKVRCTYPEYLNFNCEGLKLLMIHIAGNPEKYNARIKEILLRNPVDILICGHSHLLKVIRSQTFGHLHINPGAAGIHGFHQVRTLLRFKIHQGKLSDLDVVELGPRSKSA